MAEATEFTIGAGVRCTDGVCGEVSRVVVDPIARAVTHLVVEPEHRRGLGRLVPLDLVDATAGEVKLRCTLEAFEKLDLAEESQFLPGNVGYANYGPDSHSLGLTTDWVPASSRLTLASASATLLNPSRSTKSRWVRSRCAAASTSTRPTRDIGQVQGLVIDPSDRQVTHVLLQEGHLWGRKEVAIPIGAVVGVENGIRLNITKQDVQDLPAVDIDHPNGAARE